jgi:hypothetical protein
LGSHLLGSCLLLLFWLANLFLAEWMKSVGAVDDRNAKGVFRVVSDVNNPAEAAILGSYRNDNRFHRSLHHSHSYSCILVALGNHIQEGMEIMAIRKLDTSTGNSIARTH